MKNVMILVVTALSLFACDRSGDDYVPSADGTYPAVIDVGEITVMPADKLQEVQSQGSNARNWCQENLDGDGNPYCYYGLLGQAPTGVKGGATFTFRGTGDRVCVLTDPETVFWNTAVASINPDEKYSYADLEQDDGDIDLFAGLSSYYTGSPGVELGGFSGFYTDNLGNSIAIEYGECFQYGAQSGMNNAHAGRASAEYCTINTANREGKLYTVVLESFAVPLDDGALGFGAVVLDGSCGDYVINECTLFGEGLEAQFDASDEIVKDADGEIVASARPCSVQLEQASCDAALQSFCCEYPVMCGEDGDRTQCEDAPELPDSLDCPSYCTAYGDQDPETCGS
jgi:hypothetical protein